MIIQFSPKKSKHTFAHSFIQSCSFVNIIVIPLINAHINVCECWNNWKMSLQRMQSTCTMWFNQSWLSVYVNYIHQIDSCYICLSVIRALEYSQRWLLVFLIFFFFDESRPSIEQESICQQQFFLLFVCLFVFCQCGVWTMSFIFVLVIHVCEILRECYEIHLVQNWQYNTSSIRSNHLLFSLNKTERKLSIFIAA